MGRTKIPLSEKEIENAKSLAGYGFTNEEIANFLGFSERTFDRRKKDTPGFSDALAQGKVIAKANVSEKAYDMAISGEHPGMTQWWLEVVGGQKRTTVTELTGKDGAPISFTDWVKDVSKRAKKKGV